MGLGPRDRFDAGAAFSAGFAFSKRLAGKRREDVAIALPPSNEPQPVAKALIEGAIVATRGPGLRKSEANRHAFDTLSLVIGPEAADDDETFTKSLQRAEIVGEAVNLARDLVNTPPGDKAPARLCGPDRTHRFGRRSGELTSGTKTGFAASGSAACSVWPRVPTSLHDS